MVYFEDPVLTWEEFTTGWGKNAVNDPHRNLVLVGNKIVGKKFKQGKWLRLMAGNTFSPPGEEAKETGKTIGSILYFSALILLILALFFGRKTLILLSAFICVITMI